MFKLSAAVVLVVKKRTLTAVAIRCSVTQNDDGVGVLRGGGAKEINFLFREQTRNSAHSTPHSVG